MQLSRSAVQQRLAAGARAGRAHSAASTPSRAVAARAMKLYTNPGSRGKLCECECALVHYQLASH